ncbi:unnamed protein product [Discosporangium mesarthrocarpum]
MKAQVLEELLHGALRWTPRQEHFKQLRSMHHRFLLRCIGSWRWKTKDDHPVSYQAALGETGCILAGFVVRIDDTRLPKIMFGELVAELRREVVRRKNGKIDLAMISRSSV